MSTIQIADKTTLDNTKTNTTNLLTKGGIKYNATTQKYQTYNTINSSWVDTEFGKNNTNPTIIIPNQNGLLNNKSITVSNTALKFVSTKSMGILDYLIFEVPMLSEYTITDGTKSMNCKLNSIGGIICPFIYNYISFSSGTDEQIAEILDAHYNSMIDISNFWSIGDTRTIHLDSFSAPDPNSRLTWVAQDIVVTIVAFNHTDLATPINGHTKAAITVQTKELLSGTSAGSAGTIFIDGSSSYDTSFKKWGYPLYMRTYLNNQVWGAFPTDFKSLIKSSTHYRHTTYNGSGSERVTDNLFLPSYPEIYGTASYSGYAPTSPVEGTQFAYYQTSTNRVKYPNNNGVAGSSAYDWWQGSASSYYGSSDGYRWCVVGTDGTATRYYGASALGLAPAFAM